MSCAYIFIYACICPCLCTCAYVHMYIHFRSCTCICAYACVCKFTYICPLFFTCISAHEYFAYICTCAYVCICICFCEYVLIHIHVFMVIYGSKLPSNRNLFWYQNSPGTSGFKIWVLHCGLPCSYSSGLPSKFSRSVASNGNNRDKVMFNVEIAPRVLL